MTVTYAYGVQMIYVHGHRRDGQQVPGNNMGLTSAAMKRQMGFARPDLCYSRARGRAIP